MRGAAGVGLLELGRCGALLGGEVRAGDVVVGLLGIVRVSKEHTCFDAAIPVFGSPNGLPATQVPFVRTTVVNIIVQLES